MRPIKAGEFILGYPDEDGPWPTCRNPEILSATAATWPIAGCRSTWASFASSSAQHGETPEEQELVAAKLMGRWRSGAPLVLAPDKDDPELGADLAAQQQLQLQGRWTRHGYAVPLGAHIRRMNPARHRREHEPAPDDPPRGHLRPTSAGRRARRRQWSAASPPS